MIAWVDFSRCDVIFSFVCLCVCLGVCLFWLIVVLVCVWFLFGWEFISFVCLVWPSFVCGIAWIWSSFVSRFGLFCLYLVFVCLKVCFVLLMFGLRLPESLFCYVYVGKVGCFVCLWLRLCLVFLQSVWVFFLWLAVFFVFFASCFQQTIYLCLCSLASSTVRLLLIRVFVKVHSLLLDSCRWRMMFRCLFLLTFFRISCLN